MRLHPTCLPTKALSPPILQSVTPRARNRDLPWGTICFCLHICRAPLVASVGENCELDELLGGNVWSFPHPPPASLLAITGLMGPQGGSAEVASLASSVSIESQSLGVHISQQGPQACPGDINSSPVLEVQETIKNLMHSGEDFK